MDCKIDFMVDNIETASIDSTKLLFHNEQIEFENFDLLTYIFNEVQDEFTISHQDNLISIAYNTNTIQITSSDFTTQIVNQVIDKIQDLVNNQIKLKGDKLKLLKSKYKFNKDKVPSGANSRNNSGQKVKPNKGDYSSVNSSERGEVKNDIKKVIDEIIEGKGFDFQNEIGFPKSHIDLKTSESSSTNENSDKGQSSNEPDSLVEVEKVITLDEMEEAVNSQECKWGHMADEIDMILEGMGTFKFDHLNRTLELSLEELRQRFVSTINFNTTTLLNHE